MEFRLRGHYIKAAIPEARTKAEAEQVQTHIKRAIFDDKYNRAAGNKDFTEFVDEVFVPWAKASKRSWQDDEERARPLKAFFEGKRLRDITPMLIEKYKQQRLNTDTLHKRKRSPATVNRELQVLSKVYSMADDNGLVETNPMRRVHRLREALARERYLTDDEENQLFAILVGRRAHIRPIVVALQTGMRQGEILGLTWKNVDFEQKTIYVAHTKTGRPRKLPMNEPVEVELKISEAECFVRGTCLQLCPNGLEVNDLQARVGRSMFGGEDFRSSISRSASHVRDAVKRKGCTRDGHHDTVGSHHFADDISLHACYAGETPCGG